PIPSTSHFAFFSFLLIPHSPRSTLFPYTTLFRSMLRVPGQSANTWRSRLRMRSCCTRRPSAVPPSSAVISDGRRVQHDRILRRLDRKSTRLNSSHSQISYAVFCLKKKKKKQIYK